MAKKFDKILVTGASGRLGNFVAPLLQELGYRPAHDWRDDPAGDNVIR